MDADFSVTGYSHQESDGGSQESYGDLQESDGDSQESDGDSQEIESSDISLHIDTHSIDFLHECQYLRDHHPLLFYHSLWFTVATGVEESLLLQEFLHQCPYVTLMFDSYVYLA